jgi:hypothetical protein
MHTTLKCRSGSQKGTNTTVVSLKEYAPLLPISNHENEDLVGTNVLNEAGDGNLFVSICNSNDIPDVARGLSWNDSFYCNDSDVIAVFDFDHKKFDREIMLSYFNLAVQFVVVAVFAFITFGALGVNLTVGFYVQSILIVNLQQYQRRRTHIAIARQGIYIDVVDEPGSHTVMRRIIKTYDEIRKCRVEETSLLGRVQYSVVLDAANNPAYTISDILLGPQKFVDIVNAMKERTRLLKESAESKAQCNDETTEITPEVVFAVAEMV